MSRGDQSAGEQLLLLHHAVKMQDPVGIPVVPPRQPSQPRAVQGQLSQAQFLPGGQGFLGQAAQDPRTMSRAPLTHETVGAP